ncbi:MAG: DUF378 domain-containing protein [Sphingobacteriaceae bacterium]|jgi:uncharacterized membrane protein YuzA (DUF378 family)|nr:DUF378 domain-containing protein [Sphingobacteriaceae bacterium]
MKTIFRIALLLTVIGAINSAIYGLSGTDFFLIITGIDRTIGGDFLRILIGLSAIVTLIFGLKLNWKEKK